MRGRTFKNSFIIADEMSSSNPEQMKNDGWMEFWQGKKDWDCRFAIVILYPSRLKSKTKSNSEKREVIVMDEKKLLERITVNPKIFGGKPIIRGRRIAVEHILGMLAAGDTIETILEGYPWLEQEDIQACLVYARRMVGHERIETFPLESHA